MSLSRSSSTEVCSVAIQSSPKVTRWVACWIVQRWLRAVAMRCGEHHCGTVTEYPLVQCAEINIIPMPAYCHVDGSGYCCCNSAVTPATRGGSKTAAIGVASAFEVQYTSLENASRAPLWLPVSMPKYSPRGNASSTMTIPILPAGVTTWK